MSDVRARAREDMRARIKAVALQQLADGGREAVSINAIGRALGVTGPGLYRYVASRDALLEELTTDAYDDLHAAVAGARDVTAFARRVRDWAVAEPHRYRLLFAGVPAWRPALVDASHRIMRVLVALAPEDLPEPAPRLRGQLRRWSAAREGDVEPAAALWAIGVWTRLHGFVGLEIEGDFAAMGVDPALLFREEWR